MTKFCPFANFAACIDGNCGAWGLCHTGAESTPAMTAEEWVEAMGFDCFRGMGTSEAYEAYRRAVEAGEVEDSGYKQRWLTNRITEAHGLIAEYVHDEHGAGRRFV